MSRELLELAAKAAGIVIDYSHESVMGGRKTGFDLVGNAVLDWHNGTKWNPLTDDGDALRLAVKLGLVVAAHKQYVTVSLPYEGNALCHLPNGSDACAAARRSIVMAAAEIGRAM